MTPAPSSPADIGPCSRLVIYCHDMAAMAAFYGTHFGYQAFTRDDDRIIELCRLDGGLILMLHPAGKGQKAGQSLIKLVFDVEDVESTRNALIKAGVDVGPIHQADNYQFANLKDPAKNSVSISSRAFA
jgi:predicted enzyme related to lactoylglutathione lyase